MILALGILTITSLLTAAVFLAVQSDASLTRGDLDGKRAYAAAQAGLQAYLHALDDNSGNSQWWQNCANDTTNGPVTVPGSSTGVTYSYQPVVACTPGKAVGTVLDATTGLLRMEFTGKAGNYNQQRTIVASFRPTSPLSYLWYTKYETLDPIIGDSTCGRFYYSTPGPDASCYIYWNTGDHVHGPMYTQDQFLIESGGQPVFGRSAQDTIASEAPGTSVCAFGACPNGVVQGKATPSAPPVPLPSDNSNLQGDATSHGTVLTGATTLTISGTTASGDNCPTASTCSPVGPIDLTQKPIIYVANGPGCTSSYDPKNASYNTVGSGTYRDTYYGACGDLYVSGSYGTALTLAAANDIVVTGSLTNSTDQGGNTAPTGSATLGLVANQYVRVMHARDANASPVTIDGAILTLQHSFFVDNYDSGSPSTLTVHGAIAQDYRGVVATAYGTTTASGYVKDYNYDNRLALILPPYLFDLQDTSWDVVRETLCSPAAPASSTTSCSYTGP